jgi:hypothetical protein
MGKERHTRDYFLAAITAGAECAAAKYGFVSLAWLAGFFFLLTVVSYTSHYDKKSRRIVVGVAALLIFSAVYFLTRVPVLTITPQKSLYRQGDLYSYRVKNQTDDDLYACLIILRIRSSVNSANDFVFDVPQSNLRPLDQQSLNPNLVFGDIFEISGPTDSRGHPFFLIYLAHLLPSESREFNLKLVKPSVERVRVDGDVMSYSDVSQPMHKEGDTVTLPVEVREDLTMDHEGPCFITLQPVAACSSHPIRQKPATLHRGKTYSLGVFSAGTGSQLPPPQ